MSIERDLAIRELVVCEPAFLNKKQYVPWLEKYKFLFFYPDAEEEPVFSRWNCIYTKLYDLTKFFPYLEQVKQAIDIYNSKNFYDLPDLFEWFDKYTPIIEKAYFIVGMEFYEENPKFPGYKKLFLSTYEVYYSLADFADLVEFDRVYSALKERYCFDLKEFRYDTQLKELSQTKHHKLIRPAQDAYRLIEACKVYLAADDYLPWLEEYKKLNNALYEVGIYKEHEVFKNFRMLYSELFELDRLIYFQEQIETALLDHLLFVENGSMNKFKWFKIHEDCYRKTLTFMSCEITICSSEYVTLFEHYDHVFVKVSDFESLVKFRRLVKKYLAEI